MLVPFINAIIYQQNLTNYISFDNLTTGLDDMAGTNGFVLYVRNRI